MADSKRKILIERFRNNDKPLNYIKESGVNEQGKHYIGRLEGVSADFLHPTRNDRKYVLRLWKNVEKSDDFKEGMETLTIFGEADHPEDRLETSIKEVAVCLRKFEIRESEGVVWCSFDILDTPNGRIVKELLDYGSKLGVSSRGSGEEIIENGETIIDPDTYIFICFDVVIMPAVAKARPKRVESRQLDIKSTTLVESIKKEINQATTIQELNSIKSIIESQNIPGIDSLIESLNIQLSKLENGDEVSSKLITELENLTRRISDLNTENESLRNKVSASDARISGYKRLINSMKSNSKSMRMAMRENHTTIKNLQDSVLENYNQYNDYQYELDSLRSQNRILERANRRLRSENQSLSENVSSLETKKRLVEERLSSKKDESINLLESQIKSMEIQMESMKNDSESEIGKLRKHSEFLENKFKETRSNNKQLLTKYVEARSAGCHLSIESVVNKLPKEYDTSDVDKVVNTLVEQRDRMKKLPIDLEGKSISIIRESESLYDEEQQQTIKILEGIK